MAQDYAVTWPQLTWDSFEKPVDKGSENRQSAAPESPSHGWRWIAVACAACGRSSRRSRTTTGGMLVQVRRVVGCSILLAPAGTVLAAFAAENWPARRFLAFYVAPLVLALASWSWLRLGEKHHANHTPTVLLDWAVVGTAGLRFATGLRSAIVHEATRTTWLPSALRSATAGAG